MVLRPGMTDYFYAHHKKSFRKQQRVKQILEVRGEEPGLACILSAMEPCGTCKPWHDNKTHRTYLKPDDGKCLPYYAYFIDKDRGLCYARVPSWCPFRLQVYSNGHSYLARQLSKRTIEYRLRDNAFGWIADSERAQEPADEFSVEMRHRKLDEFATDVVFAKPADWQAIYDRLTRAAIHTVKPDNIAPLPGPQTEGQLPGRDGQPGPHPHRGNTHQAHHGAGVDQNVRQVPADPAD